MAITNEYRKALYSLKLPIELILIIKDFAGDLNGNAIKKEKCYDNFDVKFRTRHKKRSFSF